MSDTKRQADWRDDLPAEEGIGVRHATIGDPRPGTRRLRVTFEVDGEVIRVLDREVTEQYVWYLRGNSSWREF
ncbi:MAG: hypothetical protein ACT4P5_03680 [Armatimonadota bacterium]